MIVNRLFQPRSADLLSDSHQFVGDFLDSHICNHKMACSSYDCEVTRQSNVPYRKLLAVP